MSDPADQKRPFWDEKPLAAMTEAEWESLCDGCGKCCLVLIEDEDDAQAGYLETRVHCKLFDPKTRRCTQYATRQQLVPGCVQVSADNAPTLDWMPDSCAYRRLAEGRGLAPWHPLITGDPDSVVAAGVAVKGPLISERRVRVRNLWRYVTGTRG